MCSLNLNERTDFATETFSDHGKGNRPMKATWPAWYPTRTLQEWEKARAHWVPSVSREPGKDVDRPVISHSKRKNKNKSDKFEMSKKFFVQ